jgi:phosphopentomutase
VPRLRLPKRTPRLTRVILLIMDSVGIGALPDAAAYRDEGSDTLGHIATEVPLSIPTLRSLGLGRVATLGGADPPPMGAYGRMAEASAGKDSVTGHWEMAGLVLDKAFPTFPNGFSSVSIEEFERRIGRRTLGNVVGSGTEIIDRFGDEHIRTGAPIVYTSADSVFQIAAHEEVISIEEQYRICHEAFEIYARGLGVARIIARPFVGTPGHFTRTANRRDFAIEPPNLTLLDLVVQSGRPVVAIGKIEDLFAGRGISRAIHTTSDDNGMDVVLSEMASTDGGLIITNLVDFDTKYGHRNDVPGYAANLERFDVRLAEVLGRLRPTDLLVVTADHGNDPSTRSTDHSREYVPVLVAGPHVRAGVDLGTRATFADLGQTIADLFGIRPLGAGTSFLSLVLK